MSICNALRWAGILIISVSILCRFSASKVDSISAVFQNKSCIGSYSNKVFSREEIILRFVIQKFCGRELLTSDRLTYYNVIKNGEIDIYELIHMLTTHSDCPHISDVLSNRSDAIKSRVKAVDLNNWQARMPNQIYSWTVDFHPSPSSCNINLYSEIGVVLHPEIDHKPFCYYSGWCKNRMKLFGLGGYMAGFALDPDHNVLKKDFYEIYKNDSEFNRIDVFMCSHPAANCELFEKFEKPMVVFLTTRLEFGRDDKQVGWRAREMAKWNSWGELDSREQSWISFIMQYHKSGRLAFVANNKYDAEYGYYYTGIRPIYIPSWCGNADGSYGLQSEWTGCVDSLKKVTNSNNEVLYVSEPYKPIYDKILIVPYKQALWAAHSSAVDESHALYVELKHAYSNFSLKYPNEPVPMLNHSNHEIKNHVPEKLALYKALVYVPYQTSVMTFFEIYRQNIPMFTPSASLLIKWELEHKLLQRIYGHPTRHFKEMLNSSIPDPNSNSIESLTYWIPFSDQFHFPHIQTFDSFSHLLELIRSTNFTSISEKMSLFNQEQRIDIQKKWDDVFGKLVPHRDRKLFKNQRDSQFLDLVNDFS